MDTRQEIMDSRVNVAVRKVLEAIKDLTVGDAIMILEQVKFERQMDAWENMKQKTKQNKEE